MKNRKILLLVLLAPLIAQGNVIEKPNYTLVYAKAGKPHHIPMMQLLQINL